jgi:hypothetical protein
MDMYNPIKSVDGVAVKSPSVYKWKLEDLSASDAGRTEDTVMDKKRIGQLVGIELQWNKVSIADASTILKLFNPEYIKVEYLDAMQGTYVERTFYVGERSVPLYNGELGLWDNITFNLIGRSGV